MIVCVSPNIYFAKNIKPLSLKENKGKAFDSMPETLFFKDSQAENLVPGDIKIHQWNRAERLFNIYKNSLDENKRPIKVLDLIAGDSLSPDETMKFLTNITSDEKTADAFIDEITRDEDGKPAFEKSKDVVRILVQKLGGKENFERWYTAPNGYLGAFSNYGKKLYQNAKNINELCKFLPNWGPWALKAKYRSTDGVWPRQTENGRLEWTDSFTIGELPEEFEDKKAFRELVLEIRRALNSENPSRLDEIVSKFGFKHAKYIVSGGSPKYKVILDDKYVLKTDKYKDNFTDSDYYNDLKDAEPDSTLLNAVMDYYVSTYKPELTAKMYFYDELTSASLYEFVDGKRARFLSDGAGFNTRTEDFKETFKELDDIGINYTDFNSANFVNTKNGIKCIDSGHSIYYDILRPGIGGLTMSLPSRTGFNPLEFHGRLADI